MQWNQKLSILMVCHRLYWAYWHETAVFCVYKQEHFIIFHYYIAFFIWHFQPQSMEEEDDSNSSYIEVDVNPDSD